MTLGEQQPKIAHRAGAGVNLAFADLDALKSINDNFGHTEGDRALRDMAFDEFYSFILKVRPRSIPAKLFDRIQNRNVGRQRRERTEEQRVLPVAEELSVSERALRIDATQSLQSFGMSSVMTGESSGRLPHFRE